MQRGLERLTEEQLSELHGLLHADATAVWSATYQFAWERDRATQRAVDAAVDRVRAGDRRLRTDPRDAPPRWLSGLVRRCLEEGATTYYSWGRFGWVRRLERLGLVAPEHDDTWVLAALGGLGVQHKPFEVVDYLMSDPELRDELVWRLFEVEGGGEISLANVDSFSGEPWRGGLLTLVADGTLPRDRFLDGCLQALSRDFNQYRAKWFSATWAALEPTAEERTARVPLLLPVLRSSARPVVSFAVKELITADRAAPLDAVAVVPALAPAVHSPVKGTALAALRLAASLAARAPCADVVPLARDALGHPHADVQTAAGELLVSLGEDDVVTEAADSLSPVALDELGRSGTEVRPHRTAPTRFEPRAPMPPPTSDSATLELAAALLEDASDAYAVEALLAALASGRGEGLPALVKRARAVSRASTDHGGGAVGVPGHVAGLVLTAAGESPGPAPHWLPRDTPPLVHLRGRFQEVAEVLAGLRRPAPLLATPDLRGGHVTPCAVLERLGDRTAPPSEDATAALLRLARGEGRDEVLDRLGPQVHPAVLALARDPLSGPASRSRLVGWHVRSGEDAGRSIGLAVPDGPGGAITLEPPRHQGDLNDWLALLALLVPADAEHFAALAHYPLFCAVRYAGNWRDASPTLDLLADHGGRHAELSATVVALGLAAGRGDQRVHAVDALVDLVGTERLTMDEVADAIVRQQSLLPASRWAESLAAAGAAAGPTLPIAVLTRVLPTLPSDLRGLHAPLGVLLEESLRAGQPPTDPDLRAWLSRLSGSSKAARSARRLLG